MYLGVDDLVVYFVVDDLVVYLGVDDLVVYLGVDDLVVYLGVDDLVVYLGVDDLVVYLGVDVDDLVVYLGVDVDDLVVYFGDFNRHVCRHMDRFVGVDEGFMEFERMLLLGLPEQDVSLLSSGNVASFCICRFPLWLKGAVSMSCVMSAVLYRHDAWFLKER